MDKIKTTIVLSLGTLILAISGCSSHTPLYNYGDYSESYYALKKESTADTALEYKQALEYCIKEADDSRSGRVPPGIYANLGYLYLKAGKNKKAVEYFTKEKSTYPEAAFFMDKMIN
ncbi:MAG: DUF4810 domain-containing protein, partial [Sulfurimonas sp.]